MKSQLQNIIFAVLKVVRRGDLEHAPFGKHNNINRIEFRPASQYAYFMRFFYCVKNEIKTTNQETMTHPLMNSAMGEALTRSSFNFKTVIGSGQSVYGEVGAGRKDFVETFSLFFLSFSKLVTSSFPFVVFSFKQLNLNSPI